MGVRFSCVCVCLLLCFLFRWHLAKATRYALLCCAFFLGALERLTSDADASHAKVARELDSPTATWEI